jgi:lipoprotein-anchoring transpeptidase ErfK/SrfK
VAASGCGGASAARNGATVTVSVAPAARTAPPAAAPAPLPAPGRLSVHVTQRTPLHATPGGRVVGQLQPRTGFGSPTVVPVVRERGTWFGVLTPALPNGQVGWISSRAALVPYLSEYAIAVSLRRRQVVIRRDGRRVLRFPVAIGAPGTPTPTGRFAVTDKLLTNDPASPYGCCILALSATQSHTPQGWGGGDRIAMHATNLPTSIGTAASLGCLRAPEYVMRRIVRLVPLGTVVRISA